MGILVGVWGFPCLILVLFLVLKYKGVCLCLLPFFLMRVLRAMREVVASLSVGSRDTLGDSSLSSAPSFPFLSSPMSFLSSSSCRSSSSLSVSSLTSSYVSSSSSFSFSYSYSYSSFSYVSSSSSSISSSSPSTSSSSCFTSSSSASFSSSSFLLIIGLTS